VIRWVRDPLGADNPLGAVIRWVQNDPCLSNDCLGKDGGGQGLPPAGHAGEGITNIFIFLQRHTKTQKHLFHDFPKSPAIL